MSPEIQWKNKRSKEIRPVRVRPVELECKVKDQRHTFKTTKVYAVDDGTKQVVYAICPEHQVEVHVNLVKGRGLNFKKP